jgi:hypothetical protein
MQHNFTVRNAHTRRACPIESSSTTYLGDADMLLMDGALESKEQHDEEIT